MGLPDRLFFWSPQLLNFTKEFVVVHVSASTYVYLLLYYLSFPYRFHSIQL